MDHISTPTAYSYLRFSTPEQRKGSSLDRQIEGTQKLASAKGWNLDLTFSRLDLGKSAFKGDRAGLQAFLKAIEDGIVKKGSILIIEKLDRLSRAECGLALKLWLGILETGVLIATTSPERIYDKSSTNKLTDLIEVIIAFALANEESQKKSDRISYHWVKRRASGKPLTGRCPAWLRLNGDEFEVIEHKAKIVQQIFRWALDGVGARVILRRLNEKKIENIASTFRQTTKKVWNQRYVEHILTNRHVIGEFQAFRMNGKKRIPEGEPRKGYYPAIISEEDFWSVQAARKLRNKIKGSARVGCPNLFQGLAYDMDNGGAMRLVNSSIQDKKKGIRRRIASYAATSHSKDFNSFPYEIWEQKFLAFCLEITAEQLQPTKGEVNPIPGLETKLEICKGKIKKLQDQILEGNEIDSLVVVLKSLDSQKKEIEKDIDEAKTKQAQSTPKANTEFGGVLAALEAAKPEEVEELRFRIKGLLRSIIERIDVRLSLVKGNRLHKTLEAVCFFKDGRKRKMFVEMYKGKVCGSYSFQRVKVAG